MRRHNRQLVRIIKSLSVWAAVLGVVLFFSSYALAIVSDWRLAWERCSFVPMPADAVLSEVSLIDTFSTAFPIGYGCTWNTVSGGTVSSSFPNWPLTIGVVIGVILIVIAGVLVAWTRQDESRGARSNAPHD